LKAKIIHYWSFNGNLLDQVGESHLLYGTNGSSSFDKFNKSQKAVCLKSGYLRAPNGVYFGENFTVTAWIYHNKTNDLDSPRLLDFGSYTSDNIVITTGGNKNGFVEFYILSKQFETKVISTKELLLNDWNHLAVTYTNWVGRIYINGRLVGLGMLNRANKLIRTSNYIGKSNWSGNQNAIACYDEIKIFDHALDERELILDYEDRIHIRVRNTIDSNESFQPKEMPLNKNLINYWAFSGNLKDKIQTSDYRGPTDFVEHGIVIEVRGLDLNCHNSNLTNDRLENPFSALKLIDGYCEASPGALYLFNRDYTISLWIKLEKAIQSTTILNFGNLKISTIFAYINFIILDRDNESSFRSNNPLKLNVWMHLAVVYQESMNIGKIYLNGNYDSFGYFRPPQNILKGLNLIGKSNLNGQHSYASFDEIKIFNKALTFSEIQDESNYY